MRGRATREPNPFLGNRSIRWLLMHRDEFRKQLRAILRASHYGKIKLMYPMVSCVEELTAAAVVLREVQAELKAAGIPFDEDMLVGAMIEVPSAALNAEALAPLVDFFSIGTNDLVQYTMAADRGNEAVAHLYQPFNPAVLKLMRMTIEAARRNAVCVGVCGESASDPIVGVFWAALGVDVLSMSSTYIPAMAKLFAKLTRADLDDYAKVPDSLPVGATAQAIYDACHAFLAQRIPDLDNILL